MICMYVCTTYSSIYSPFVTNDTRQALTYMNYSPFVTNDTRQALTYMNSDERVKVSCADNL